MPVLYLCHLLFWCHSVSSRPEHLGEGEWLGVSGTVSGSELVSGGEGVEVGDTVSGSELISYNHGFVVSQANERLTMARYVRAKVIGNVRSFQG